MSDGARDTTSVPSGPPPGAAAEVPARGAAHPAWAEIEAHLESARRSTFEEIRDYPRPIAGCDQQFNWLLEESDRIAAELSRLASVWRADATGGAGVEALAGFIDSSACLDDGLKARLRAGLNRRLGGASGPKPPV